MARIYDFNIDKKYPIADKSLLLYENYERYMGVNDAHD